MPNVGIGTTSPNTKLHVDSGLLEINKSTFSTTPDSTNRGGLFLGGLNGEGRIQAYDFLTNSYLTFHTSTGGGATSEKVRIDSAGNVGVGTANLTQKLMVAGNIAPSADNSYDLGTSGLKFREIFSNNGTINTSDARKKTKIQDSDLGLDFINDLRPVSYYWKEGDQHLHYGVIAQETEYALSQAKAKSGRTDEVDNVIVTHDEKTDAYGVRYTELIAPMIKAIQELCNELFGVKGDMLTLKAQNADQDRSIASTKAKAAKLEAENEKLKQENAAQAQQLDALKAYLCAKDKKAAICK